MVLKTIAYCLMMGYGSDCFAGKELHQLVRKNLYLKLIIGNVSLYRLNHSEHLYQILIDILITSILIYIHHVYFILDESYQSISKLNYRENEPVIL
jgi:hypothetical protein